VTSQGQRFRRRALRRGYKVDEVDSFLDRVEATLAGDPIGASVTAQEVHDVVFRVRFGGYDEWQVDLHLDRVERQLAELEERGGVPGDPRLSPDRLGPAASRMGPPTDRMAAIRDDRPMPPPMSPRPVNSMPPAPASPGGDPYGRFGDQTYAGPGGYDSGEYESFEPGRHGKMDMTAEIRMPDSRGPGYGPPPLGPRGGGPGMGGTPPMSPPPLAPSPMSGPPMGGTGGDVYRVDQLRRTFQPRRFGSGYDPGQVDRLFEAILAAMSGRGPMPVSENELDTVQFGLVPGGYFEAEVDAALREVRDILRRR
jgi:DivIVA domain-containing protein